MKEKTVLDDSDFGTAPSKERMHCRVWKILSRTMTVVYVFSVLQTRQLTVPAFLSFLLKDL